MEDKKRAQIFADCKCRDLIKEGEILKCSTCGFLRSSHSAYQKQMKISKKNQ